MTNNNQKNKATKYHYFHNTMTDLLKACFSGTDKNCIKKEEAVDFFLYIVKHKEESDSYRDEDENNTLDRYVLKDALASKGNKSDIQAIPILSDFLNLYILSADCHTPFEKSYRDKSGNLYIKKSSPELLDYCKTILGFKIINEKDIPQDFLIDIITICFVVGRHLLHTQTKPLSNFYSSDFGTNLLSLLHEKKAHFTIVHGRINERKSRYMAKYIINQLHNVSYNLSYEQYQENWLPKSLNMSQWKSKYPEIVSQLSQAIFNVYLMQNEEHYLIIYGISEQDALNNLINNCRLCKNIILICDFDIDSFKASDSISYLTFQNFYQEPLLINIKNYFGKKFTPTNGLCNTLLKVSKGNLYILHAQLLLVKNLSNSDDVPVEWEEDLKNNLDVLSLEADKSTLPTQKYSMPDIDENTRTGNNLIGHIRRLYNNILSSRERLLVLLIALHGENGMPEEVLLKILPQNADDTINSLIDNHLISKEGTLFIYNDSLLIPYALIYGKQSLDDSSSSFFSDILDFMKFMINEMCYYNSKPISYNIFCITLKKTYKAIFILLHQSEEYNEHFSEIWYYHIRCTNFFLENGDINSLNELKENFQPLAEKLMDRPGENKHWKKLYQIYVDFLDLHIKTINTPSASWESHSSLIDRIISQIKKYGLQFFPQDDYQKLVVYLLEVNIYYLFHLCKTGLQKCYFSCVGTNPELYIKKLQKIKDMSENILLRRDFTNDKFFISEMKNTFNTIKQLAEIYIPNDNHSKSYLEDTISLELLFAEPRYIQLSRFQIYCFQLIEQCRTGYASRDSSNTLQTTNLKCTIVEMYRTLDLVPLYILEDYYNALINYTLTIAPFDTKKLLDYLYKDYEPYKHIWHHSSILSRIYNTISKITVFPNHNE